MGWLVELQAMCTSKCPAHYIVEALKAVRLELKKAIVDDTSPALCTPVTPFLVDPIFSKRGSDGMIPCAA